MPKHAMIAVAVLSLGLPAASHSAAPTASLVVNTVVQPVGVKRGDTLRPGTLIETGADGLIVYTETWTSQFADVPCVAYTLVGYGASTEVVSRATPGHCLSRAMTAPRPGQSLISWGTRYEQGSADDGRPVPPEVAAANQEWSEFDAWMKSARQGMGPLMPGLVYLQGDYRSEVVGSAEACSALCAQEAQCRAMTFIISQQRCWLKDTVPPTAESGDMISAAKQ
jgi:hypothetical protein